DVHASSAEITGHRNPIGGANLLPGTWGGTSFDFDTEAEQVACNGNVVDCAGGLDTREHAQPVDRFTVEGSTRVAAGVVGSGYADVHGDHAVRLETGFDVAEFAEALHQQTGAGQQHKRESNLAGYEDTAESATARAAGSTDGVFQCRVQVYLRGAQSGRKTKQ